MSNDKNRRQNSLPVVTTQHMNMNVDDRLSFKFRKDKVKTIIKMLVGLYLYKNEDFNEEQSEYLYFALNELNLKIELGMEKNLLSYETTLITMVIKRSLVTTNLPNWLHRNSYFCTAYEFYGNIGNGFTFSPIIYKRRPKRLHHEKYIGVGYKDKGTATDLAFDANPSWTSIATYNHSLEKDVTDFEQSNVLKLSNVQRTVDLGFLDFSRRPERAYFQGFENNEGILLGFKNTSEIAKYNEIPEEFWNLVHLKLGTKTTNGNLFLL